VDYKEAYERRLGVLRAGYGDAKDAQMRDLYQRGLDLIDDAAAIYLELGTAASREQEAHAKCAEIRRVETKARLDLLVREVDELAKRDWKAGSEDDNLATSEAATLLAKLSGEGAKQETQRFMDSLRDQRTDAVADLDKAFREDILIGDTSALTKEVLRSATMFGVGLVPGAGSLVDAILRWKALDDFERSKDQTANERVHQLERSYEAIRDFRIAAQTLINRLDGDTEIWMECQGLQIP
jgi:hypothetical protein